jgi:PBSX family phage terminase large subunit
VGIAKAVFRYKPFSKKQKQALTWWIEPEYDSESQLINEGSPFWDKDALIADGAVRSGKTLTLSLSFILWAMSAYKFANFGLSGKTIGSLRRNVIFTLKIMIQLRGYKIEDRKTENLLIISKDGVENYFYLFGGKDEKSQDLVQGFTAAGFFFDEVVLMPQSFVNQAIARCSEEGAKLWFNCNPDGPFHWFKTEWIDKLLEKNALRIHFDLDDNPSLSEKVKDTYRRRFSGIFYQRMILGLWVIAEGIIYPDFNKEKHCITEEEVPELDNTKNASDYGITNPMVFLKAGIKQINGEPHLFILDEYYNDGKGSHEGKIKTDLLFLEEYNSFNSESPIKRELIIDPSATSLINLFRQNGIIVRAANNEVLEGINNVSMWLKQGRIHIVESKCPNLIKEFSSYAWDVDSSRLGKDKPIKENDHALDALRYLIQTLYPIRTSKAPLNVRGVN